MRSQIRYKIYYIPYNPDLLIWFERNVITDHSKAVALVWLFWLLVITLQFRCCLHPQDIDVICVEAKYVPQTALKPNFLGRFCETTEKIGLRAVWATYFASTHNVNVLCFTSLRVICLVCSYVFFPFGIEGRVLILIVPVPGHCLSFTFISYIRYLNRHI